MNFFAPESLSQAINPWSWWVQSDDNVTGLINIVNYKTGDAAVEKAVVQDVAGYGMQLNIIGRALEAVIASLPDEAVTLEHSESLRAFGTMMQEIEAKKKNIAKNNLSTKSVGKLIENLRDLKQKNPALHRQITHMLRDELDA